MMQSYDVFQPVPTFFMIFTPGYYDKGAKSMTLLLTPFKFVILSSPTLA